METNQKERTEETRKLSPTWEAAMRLRGDMIVYDESLFYN